MRWRVLAILGVSIAASVPEARACSPVPLDPPLPGESSDAYRVRVEALQREREAQRPALEAEWLRDRQAQGLEHAPIIFIARKTPWTPPPRRSTRRVPPPPPPVYSLDYSVSYYTPVAWLRGRPTSARFSVQATRNSCGGMTGVGDETLSEPGTEFIFFATGVPFTELTLIDAIAVDRVTDPTLVAFIARSRR
jgi:hypothetical protein